LEAVEEDFYMHLGNPRTNFFQNLKVGFPRVEVWCRYRKPARLGDWLDVTVWFEKRTRTAFILRFEIRREGETDLVAEATSRLVCVNRQFQPVPLPEEFLSLFRDYLPPLSTHEPASASGSLGAHSR
jgi:acyl-CoA thioesterase FadM